MTDTIFHAPLWRAAAQKCLNVLVAWLLLALLPWYAYAQGAPQAAAAAAAAAGSQWTVEAPPAKELSPGHGLVSPLTHAVRTTVPIVLNGVMDEAIWAAAPPVRRLIQRDPKMGELTSEPTEVRILFDTDNLYIAVYCYDAEPQSIVATELRYDAEMEGDDIFEVMIDTFHDHRSGYRFRVNPLGTIRDQSVGEEGLIVNENWDEKWEAKARITNEGWFAEMRIPFAAMRFPEGDNLRWGINFHRTIIRKNEDSFWSGYNRGYTLTRISGGGHMDGLEGIKGMRLRVKPYVAGRMVQTPELRGTHSVLLGDVGIEDAKFLITPQFALDMTVNPDFAQAEVDQAQVNLSRFNLFFPEKREFFQEGSGIFQFGTGSRFGTSSDLIVFHSRRIGLNDRREEIPILAGLKLSGKQGPLEIGALNMQTRRREFSDGIRSNEPSQNFTVLRAKVTVMPRSYAGFIATRNTGSRLGGDNRTLGFDTNFSLKRYLNLQGFVSKTFTRSLQEKAWAGKAAIEWSSDHYQYSVEHMRVDENYRPEMGYVRRFEAGWNGLEQTKLEAAYKPRPGWEGVRQLNFSTAVDYFTDRAGLLDTREARGAASMTFQSGDIIRFGIARYFERLQTPFRIAGGGGTVPIGDYRFNRYNAQYTLFSGKTLSGNFNFERTGYYDGSISTFTTSPFWRANANFSLSPGFAWNRITRLGNSFDTRQLNLVGNYSLSQKWLTRSTFVLNSQDHSVLMNFRVNYLYKPGDDLFLVYSESRIYGDLSGLVNRALIAKLTYSVDF
ncbi:MAG: hypothetical protein EXQ56_12915 [Acidobacteria bacterium]|nr:hypothetical protein [Acidobacteriota bacterium]